MIGLGGFNSYGLVVKWLSRLPVTEEIAGSKPVEPANVLMLKTAVWPFFCYYFGTYESSSKLVSSLDLAPILAPASPSVTSVARQRVGPCRPFARPARSHGDTAVGLATTSTTLGKLLSAL